MPGADTPIVDLGSQLLALLLITLAWVALAALIAGAGFWILASRDRPVLRGGGEILFASSASRAEPRARKFLRVAFGVLWIVDGLLQAQPKMPGGFVGDILEPGVASGPVWFGDLVAPIDPAGRIAKLVQTMVTLGHDLGLVVVAEGVETPGQIEFLRQAGCDRLQGFGVSAPVSATAFTELLTSARELGGARRAS